MSIFIRMQWSRINECTGIEQTVGRLAAKRLVCKALQIRRKHAGFLLTSIKLSLLPNAMILEKGECVVAKEVPILGLRMKVHGANLPQDVSVGCVSDGKVADKVPAQCKLWECSRQCKPLSECEANSILSFRAAFEQPIEKVRQALAQCDMGCPYGHYIKLVGSLPVDLKGHPIVCYSGDRCTSNLRILREASTHFPVLRRFLAHDTSALSAHRIVYDIDNALKNGNHQRLLLKM